MAAEVTTKILIEIRDEMRSMKEELSGRIDSLRETTATGFDKVQEMLDAIRVAGEETRINHEVRIRALETSVAVLQARQG